MSISRYLSIFANFLNSSGVLTKSGGGTGLTSTPSNGQLLIGNGTGFTLGTITQGTAITVTNGAGSVALSTTATGTVTSVATGTGLTGGTITTSGTISLVTTAGAVGTYACLLNTPNSTISFGGTQSGANLKPSGFSTPVISATTSQGGIIKTSLQNSAQSGTWQCMGYAIFSSPCTSFWGSSIWIRIA